MTSIFYCQTNCEDEARENEYTLLCTLLVRFYDIYILLVDFLVLRAFSNA